MPKPDSKEIAGRKEQKAAENRSAPSGRIVYRAILNEGRDELKRSSSALFWSGLAAGLSMGFSLISEGLLQAYLPDARWRPLIVKLGYSMGFLIVVLGRQQLFTENTLTPILPLLNDRSRAMLWNVLRLWGIVLVANLLGACMIAWAISHGAIFDPAVERAFVSLGNEAMQSIFWVVIAKGVFAGWLIALMVWLLPFAESGRIWIIILITYIVGLANFSHIIAGSVEVFALAASGHRGWGDVLFHYVLPTLIGNIIGGVMLVAVLNHAQVVSGEEGPDL